MRFSLKRCLTLLETVLQISSSQLCGRVESAVGRVSMWWCTLQQFGSTAARPACSGRLAAVRRPPSANAGQDHELQSALSGQTSVSSPCYTSNRAPQPKICKRCSTGFVQSKSQISLLPSIRICFYFLGFDLDRWVRFLGREILRTSAKALFLQFVFGKEWNSRVYYAHL